MTPSPVTVRVWSPRPRPYTGPVIIVRWILETGLGVQPVTLVIADPRRLPN